MMAEKNWADRLADVTDRAVAAAQEAWDSTEQTRSKAWDSVVSSTNQVGDAATEVANRAKSSWKSSAEEPAEEPAATDEPAVATESVDGLDGDVEEELREAISEQGDDEAAD